MITPADITLTPIFDRPPRLERSVYLPTIVVWLALFNLEQERRGVVVKLERWRLAAGKR